LWEVLFTLGSIAAVGAFFIRGAPSSRGRDSYLKRVPLLPTASGEILSSSEEAGGEVESRLEGAREILASRASIVGEKIRDIVSIGAMVSIVSEPLVLAIAGYGLRVVLKMFRAHPITMVVGSCVLVFFLSRRGQAETLRGIGTRTMGRVSPLLHTAAPIVRNTVYMRYKDRSSLLPFVFSLFDILLPNRKHSTSSP
jgi:hypothetical protein